MRWAGLGDLPLATEMVLQLAREQPGLGLVRLDVVNWLADLLARPDHACLIGENEGLFLGIAGEHGWTGRPAVFEIALWVHPQFRGKPWLREGLRMIRERFGPVDVYATVLDERLARYLRMRGFKARGTALVGRLP